jgi:group I intron endonuclease
VLCFIPYKYTKEAGIYIFTHKVNGKKYVGESLNIYIRMNVHVKMDIQSVFHNALRKYGWDGFDLKIMYFPDITKKDLLDLEETFIFLESSLVSEHGYNVCERGNDTSGYKHSDETRKRMSEARKNMSFETRKKISDAKKNMSDETRKKIGEAAKGRKHSDEARKKMAKAARGKIVSDETRKKMSESLKGIKHSDETRKKISESRKGKIVSEETRKKISETVKGRKHSDEARKKMSEAKRNISDETRKKISDAAKKRWKNNKK